MKVYLIQFSIRTLFMGTFSLDSYHLSQCVWKEEDGGWEAKGTKDEERERQGGKETETLLL